MLLNREIARFRGYPLFFNASSISFCSAMEVSWRFVTTKIPKDKIPKTATSKEAIARIVSRSFCKSILVIF